MITSSDIDYQPQRRIASVLLCAILIVNAVFGAVGIATAGTANHHQQSEMTSSHLEYTSSGMHHETGSGHHDCCDSVDDGCVGMMACATHCAQPLTTVFVQPLSLSYLSYKLATTPIGSLAAIDPTRHFRPPRV